MPSHPEHPERLSQEIDRYLFAASDLPRAYSPEEKGELALGLQLLHTDFSHQSKLYAHLRHNIELELGVRSSKQQHRLVHYARSRRWIALIKHYLPVLITLLLILSAWSWIVAIPAPSAESYLLHPAPQAIITTVLATNQQSAEFDPKPVSTPLSSSFNHATSSSTTDTILQQTPIGLTFPGPNTRQP